MKSLIKKIKTNKIYFSVSFVAIGAILTAFGNPYGIALIVISIFLND